MERFVADSKSTTAPCWGAASVDGCTVLPSCADLFVFYKKCLLQCARLSTGPPILALTAVFKKYLRQFASRILQPHLPRYLHEFCYIDLNEI